MGEGGEGLESMCPEVPRGEDTEDKEHSTEEDAEEDNVPIDGFYLCGSEEYGLRVHGGGGRGMCGNIIVFCNASIDDSPRE
jgi:hypothetical protein